MSHNLTTVAGMTFGVILPNKGLDMGPNELDAVAGTASELGWRSAWVTDHLMVPQGDEADEYGSMLEALTTIAWVGGRHENLILGTSVISAAMRDAPLLAKEFATLDVLLGGRLIVGVGTSDSGDLGEYTNMGKADRFARRGAYVDETIRLWRHLWSGNTDPFHGDFHQLDDFTFAPLPVQEGGIPIWVGGRSARALRRTAESCDGYHAAQTGPRDLSERLPLLREALDLTGRPWPTISTRARVKPHGWSGSTYAISGSASVMANEVIAFVDAGNNELILVFDATTPDGLAAQMQEFQHEVIDLARERRGS